MSVLEEVSARSHLSSGAGFVQVAKQHLALWEDLIEESPAAARLWVWLVKRADRRNMVHASAEVIMDGTQLPRRTFYRAMALLQEGNWVATLDNAIHLNAKLVWSGRANTIGMAKLLIPVTVPKAKDKAVAALPKMKRLRVA